VGGGLKYLGSSFDFIYIHIHEGVNCLLNI